MTGPSDISGVCAGDPVHPAGDTDVLAAQTQQLLDAITRADSTVWSRLLDEDATITDENGTLLSKVDIVDSFTPHPPHVSASIRAEDLRVHLSRVSPSWPAPPRPRIPTGGVVVAQRSPLRSRSAALPDRARMPRRHLPGMGRHDLGGSTAVVTYGARPAEPALTNRPRVQVH